MINTDWPTADNEVPGAGGASAENANATTHLWEESWDDDDTSEDFSKQLKYVTLLYTLPTVPHLISFHCFLLRPVLFAAIRSVLDSFQSTTFVEGRLLQSPGKDYLEDLLLMELLLQEGA